ncbi:MAG: hypothetical protein L3J71_06585 [Victivallaceae bacterium]|nr:hypothetical protein [Victivallaceae bacterium]
MTKAIDEVIETVEKCKQDNYPQINIEKLLDYLYAVKKEYNEDNQDLPHKNKLQLRSYEAQCALQLQQYQAQCESKLEEFRSVMSSGQNALKTGLLLNGGAAITVLAFIGNMTNNHKYMLPYLAKALGCFAFGALIVSIAAFLTYVAQRKYHESKKPKDRHQRIGDNLNWSIAALGVIAIVFFCVGACYSYNGIISKESKEKPVLVVNKQPKNSSITIQQTKLIK